MTESLRKIKHGFKESYLKHCSALDLVKTLRILFFLCLFLLTGSEQLMAQTLTLENEYLYVKFQQSLPAVDHYVLKSNNQVIYGDIAHYGDMGQYHARVYYEGRQHTIYPAVASITKGGDRVCYHLKCELNLQQVVTFDLCYTLSGNSVELSFGNVEEIPGYKLIVVRSPHLLTVRADQGGAKLVFPWAEGRLIDVATTTPGSYIDGTSGWAHAMTLGILYHQGALAICSYDNLDTILEESVFDDPDKGRVGVIAIQYNYRIPPNNYELASFVDVFDEQTTSLSAKLTFLADYDQDGDIDWIDGAKFLRDQVQAIPEPRYVSSWITKLVGSRISNITQHLETIEKLYHLTDHNKIYIYLLDYGPIFSIFGYEGDLNPQWASLDELKYVFETAEKSFNTFLSFHDNYLNYYPGTPGYDPALRVVDSWGAVVEGYPLPGYSGAYIADAYEYAVQVGLERVRRTLSRYPIKESHHIDAFHFLPFIDFSLESPSNREKNRRGINLIIDEFNKYGVDVTAEGLMGFFVGRAGWFLDTPRILECNLPWSGAEYIPLIEFIYHGKTLYGLYEDIYWGILPPEQVDIYTFLEPLLLGASSAAHITWEAPDDLGVDKFHLIDLPWMALNQRFMEDYIVDGSYRKITYDDDTFVEIDYDSNTYTVQVDGRVIGRNYTTFFPKNENTFLIYSREAKAISEPLPDQWGKEMILLKLTENGINPSVPFQVIDGRISFQAEANTPYKLVKVNPLDKTSPTPNPMTWGTVPHQAGTSSISMLATTADDPTPPISYYFDFVGSPTGGLGGKDSEWQSGTSYTNSNLQANHKYGYRVKAKDGLNNQTAFSTTQYAYTAIQPPTGITFGTITPTSIQARSTNTSTGLSWGSSGLLIENTTNGENSGWKRNNSPWTSKPLIPNTSYTFQAKARNGDGVETDYGPSATKYTRANLPQKASFSDLTRTSIRANWSSNGNPSGTQYFCENLTTKTNSGWITETSWNSDNLTCGTSYSFRVKAKNEEGIETSWTSLGSQSTVKCVLLLTPNGGEMIPSNSSYDIQWEAAPVVESFDLYYSLDGGGSWTRIDKDVRNTTYPWPVPKIIGNKKACLVRVFGYNGARTKRIGYDTSDKPFTIEVVVAGVKSLFLTLVGCFGKDSFDGQTPSNPI
jgi:hypothetical protein